jgi:hypothetical protein
MKPLTIAQGTSVYLGRPAKPMPPEMSQAIGEMVRGISAIREAYLPQCYVKALVEPPAQILVLVLDDPGDQHVLDAVGEGLARVLPQGVHLDVWPLTPSHDLLPTIRQTKMQPGGGTAPSPTRKPWWKMFG